MDAKARKRRQRQRRPVPETPRGASRRWRWVIAAGIAVLGAAAGIVHWAGGFSRQRGGHTGPLNVLLITLDTTRADYLSCYGRSPAQTPQMDRFAREGVLFRHCATSAVMTLPSHCTIMTGLYPFVHGVRRNGVDHLPPAAYTLAEALKSAGYTTAAAIASIVLDPRFGLDQGFDAYHAVPRLPGTSGGGNLQRKGDQLCDDALDLLRERAHERFFVWAHFYDPHYPYDSPRHPDIQSAEAYADEVEYLDRQIGRLLEGLRQLGLEQNTLVVMVGDHGEGLEEHLEYQHGYLIYETCERVPLLMRCPGVIPAGRQIDAVVRTADVAPTILDLTGQPPLGSVAGVSLKPLLTGESADLRLSAYAESPQPYTVLRLSTIRTLTQERWKYVWSTSPQLFDLQADPGELHNVIRQHEDTANSLREQLRSLLTSAPPRLAEANSAALTSDDVSKLESLGYVGLTTGSDAGDSSGLDALEPQGGDPYAQAPVIRAYERARDMIGKDQFANAERELRGVLSVLPDAPAPGHDLAHVLRQQGKLDEAIRVYERLLQITPSDARARVQYAAVLVDSRRYELGAVQADQAVRSAPSDATARTILGIAYYNLAKFDLAREQLEAATRLDPGSSKALDALGRAYSQLGRFAEAAECFQRLLSVDPNSKSARTQLEAAQQKLRK
jgi:arylsulfatase A-like enzyme/Flp pilus assembly protein TadD